MKDLNSDRLRFVGGIVLRLALLIALILAAGQFADLVKQSLNFEVNPQNEVAVGHAIKVGLVAYIILTALPFVPGAEIGMALLSMFGASVAPLVYAATVISLMLAFLVGRLIPPKITAAFLTRIGLQRAAELIADTTRLPQPQRLDFLMQKTGSKQIQLLTRYRYPALALLLNMPGNFLIGGGGGIAMLAGLCGVFAPLSYFLTVAIAVLPVPLTILMMGG